MDSYRHHADRLLAIIGRCGRYVKQLRKLGAHTAATQLVRIALAADSLAARADRPGRLSIATYERKSRQLAEDYVVLLDDVRRRYPIVEDLPVPDSRANRTLKVSITLSAHDWIYIDSLIAAKYFRSRSEYFRKLYERKR